MCSVRNEAEIIASWKGDICQPVVSICCVTYNHESYIKEAIEGFLIQETNFPYEILIHDDASTDKTAQIIREYKAKYPRLIKPILQTVNQYMKVLNSNHIDNQYSKVLKMNPTFNFPRAKGEYIAICEGDDYWVAPDKLKTQVELMRQHPDINISFHSAYIIDGKELNKEKIQSNHNNSIKIFTPDEVILGDGGFMPTQSLLIKSNVLSDLPYWFDDFAPVGDYYIQVIGSIDKGALYLPMPNSAYRVNVEGSWTSRNKNIKTKISLLSANYKALSRMNDFYGGKYEKAVKKMFAKYLLNIALSKQLTIVDRLLLIKKYYNFVGKVSFVFSFLFPGLIQRIFRLLLKR
jgi:glycosyltransferase involved in cell wall biosynthesis